MYCIGGEFMSEKNDKPDFMPIGQALKRAREARGMTREQLAGIIDKAPRHIQAIENEGQLPSVELLFQLASMFDISIDQYIFPDLFQNEEKAKKFAGTAAGSLVICGIIICVLVRLFLELLLW